MIWPARAVCAIHGFLFKPSGWALKGDGNTTSTSAHLWVYGGNHGDPETLTNSQYEIGPAYALLGGKLDPLVHVDVPAADVRTLTIATLENITRARACATATPATSPSTTAVTRVAIANCQPPNMAAAAMSVR